MFLLYALLALVAVIWLYLKTNYSYWKNKGISTTDYRYVFGHLGRTLNLSKSSGEIHTEIYRAHKGYNYAGFYKFMEPAILLRNSDIIKDVLLKNFNSFHDNDFTVDEKIDLIFGKNPFVLKGDRWKTVRNQITPCFSSSKLKAMMPLLQQNGKKLLKYLAEAQDAVNEVGLEAKELCSKYTAENVASCAFGLEGKCFEDEKAEFRETGRRLMDPSFLNAMKIMVVLVVPKLASVLKIQFTPDDVTNFMRTIITQTTEYRKANKIVRNDFLDFMTELRAKINDENEFNLNDIIAHSGGFFMDGYETSSIVISFILYEIAANSDVQEKLRREVDEMLRKTNGEFTYDAIQEMGYLDCVVKESLRLHSPLMSLVKVCTEPFELPPINENNTGPSIIVEKGMAVVIPVHALHNDPKYYPDPQRFDPERFSDGKTEKGIYLPFGEGPRMCLGMRFGLLQTKLAIASVVSEYVVKVNSKTKEPLEIDSKYFLLAPVGGLWLNYHKRD